MKSRPSGALGSNDSAKARSFVQDWTTLRKTISARAVRSSGRHGTSSQPTCSIRGMPQGKTRSTCFRVPRSQQSLQTESLINAGVKNRSRIMNCGNKHAAGLLYRQARLTFAQSLSAGIIRGKDIHLKVVRCRSEAELTTIRHSARRPRRECDG